MSTPGNTPTPGALGEATIICSLGDPGPPSHSWRGQCSRQVTTFLAAPDQKVALLVIPGWADAVLVLLVLWNPQEPEKSLLVTSMGRPEDSNSQSSMPSPPSGLLEDRGAGSRPGFHSCRHINLLYR